MSLVEQVVKDTERADAERRRLAAAQYREILEREADPRPGDAEKLRQAMVVLGRSIKDLPADSAAVQHLLKLERLAAESDGRRAVMAEANQTRKQVLAWATREREKLEAEVGAKLAAADAAWNEARQQTNEAQQALNDLPNAGDWFTALVEGCSIEEARAARQEAARRSQPAVPKPDRAGLLRQLRHDFTVRRHRPSVGTVRQYVDSTLKNHGLPPVSEAEWEEYFGEVDDTAAGRRAGALPL